VTEALLYDLFCAKNTFEGLTATLGAAFLVARRQAHPLTAEVMIGCCTLDE
jgi:hypothetical protein